MSQSPLTRKALTRKAPTRKALSSQALTSDASFRGVVVLGMVTLLLSGCASAAEETAGSPGTSTPVQAEEAPQSTGTQSTGTEASPSPGFADDDASPAPGDPASPEAPASEASRDPESIHVLVNKINPLEPAQHEPGDLRVVDVPNEFGSPLMREEAASALEELFAAAGEDGMELWVTTAYRDYGFQQALYQQRAQEQGQAAADRVSARPGHSEHQTGLAADLADLNDTSCYLRACFGDSAQGRWLSDRAAEFGFIIRYPEGSEPVTGYSYEPWHLRYVGVKTAEEVDEAGLTLEEYWQQPPAPVYDDEAEDDLAEDGAD